MLHEAKLSPTEIEVLTGLIGERLEAVMEGLGSVDLQAGTKTVVFAPKDVATRDAAHPSGDVDRPSVHVLEPRAASRNVEVVLEKPGVIRGINIVSTLAGFSVVVHAPEKEVAPGLVLPAGPSYRQVYFPVDLLDRESEQMRASERAFVDFDCAIEIVADGSPSLVAYTQLYWVSASVGGLPVDEQWARPGYYQRRAVGRGRGA